MLNLVPIASGGMLVGVERGGAGRASSGAGDLVTGGATAVLRLREGRDSTSWSNMISSVAGVLEEVSVPELAAPFREDDRSPSAR